MFSDMGWGCLTYIHFTTRTLYHIDNIICFPSYKILNVDGFSTEWVIERKDILGILAINTGFWVYYIAFQDVDMLFQTLIFFSCFKVTISRSKKLFCKVESFLKNMTMF